MNSEKKTVAVGLSGGVDSSVTAAILKREGYNVIGLTMKIFDGAVKVQESRKHACYGPGEEEDIEIAVKLCRELEIPYHVFDLGKEYEKTVLDYFRKEYLSGRTPNPCVVCNHNLKFGFLIERAKESGIKFDYFATGHYARIEQVNGGDNFLKRAVDASKDQTYFLYALGKEKLAKIMFPLGNLTKSEVRAAALEFGLGAAERPESQDFIAGGDYTPLFENMKIEPGEIVDEKGRVLGMHKGVINYTVGQRKGLGISSSKPLYVLKVDARNNRIVVTEREGLFSNGLVASDMNFYQDISLETSYEVKAKIRQNHKEQDATLFYHEDNKFRIVFETAQLSVTPGQSVVLYDGERVFGGGIIESSF